MRKNSVVHGRLSRLTDEDSDFFVGMNPAAFRDRSTGEMKEVINECLAAWRDNPFARRIVSLTTQYVIGRGLTFHCEDGNTDAFLHAFWEHPLNNMDIRINEWSDELCRSGNLFILFSSDPSGMSFVRAIPAGQIVSILPRENDIEQPLSFTVQNYNSQLLSSTPALTEYPAAGLVNLPEEASVLHFPVNRPIGAQWGEPDLAPLLNWLRIYESWLEGRALLNKYRNSFLYVVNTKANGEDGRLRRQRQLNAVPPSPGSILVTGPDEEWTVLSPQLESAEANTDGDAIKRMIAAGAGVPMHFLAEPESQSKSGAEAAGGSTFRNYEQRQQMFCGMLQQVFRQVLLRRSVYDHGIDLQAAIRIRTDDISAADNLSLSSAGKNTAEIMIALYQNGLVEKEEVLRTVYRFLGETEE